MLKICKFYVRFSRIDNATITILESAFMKLDNLGILNFYSIFKKLMNFYVALYQFNIW